MCVRVCVCVCVCVHSIVLGVSESMAAAHGSMAATSANVNAADAMDSFLNGGWSDRWGGS